MSDTKPQKAVASDVTVRLFDGMINVPVDLVSYLRSDDDPELRMVCPTCTDASPLSQQYRCEHNHICAPNEAHRAISVDGTLRKVTDQEIAVLKATTVEPKTASFTIYEADAVEAETIYGKAVYRLRPRKSVEVYSMLADLIAGNPDLALVCEVNMRNAQKLYRCVTIDGALVLRELVRPGEKHEFELVTAAYPEGLLANATALARQQVQKFDPAVYVSPMRGRKEELRTAKQDPNAAQPEPAAPKAEANVDDLVSMLAASVKPKKKAPAKRAPRKTKAA